jgi:hypothetical protein
MAGSGFTNYTEGKLLDLLMGGTAFTAPTPSVGLFTAMPTDDTGSTGTEVTGGSYARVTPTNNTTSWPNATLADPSTKKNGITLTFPTATADWGTVIGFGVWDATTAGNLLTYGPLETGTVYVGTGVASTDVITAPGSALSNTNRVRLEAVEGNALPAGLSADTLYFVINASTDTFKLSLTSGGVLRPPTLRLLTFCWVKQARGARRF